MCLKKCPHVQGDGGIEIKNFPLTNFIKIPLAQTRILWYNSLKRAESEVLHAGYPDGFFTVPLDFRLFLRILPHYKIAGRSDLWK